MMTRVIGHDPDFLKFYARVVGHAYDPGHDLGHDPGHRPGHDPGHDPGFETNIYTSRSVNLVNTTGVMNYFLFIFSLTF